MAGTTRWTAMVDSDVDIEMRTFLAQRGMKKGDISRFIEDAVKWRIFDLTLAEVRSKFDDLPDEELESLIGEALTWARQKPAVS